MMALAKLLYRRYLYLYHTVINPNWFAAVLTLKRIELTAAGQLGAANIAPELVHLHASQARQAGMSHGFWLSALVVPALVALLLWPVLRNWPAKVATGSAGLAEVPD